MKHKLSLFIILLISILTSCQDEEANPVDEAENLIWEESSSITGFSKYLLNSYVNQSNTELRVFGGNLLHIFDTSGKVQGYSYSEYPLTMKMPMSDEYYVTIHEGIGQINHKLSINHVQFLESISIDFLEQDSSFNYFHGPLNFSQTNGQFAALNSRNQLLVSGRAKDNTLFYYLVEVELKPGGVGNFLELASFEKIFIPLENSDGWIPYIWGIDDKFIVSMSSRGLFGVIDSDGNYQKADWPFANGSYPSEIFEVGSSLYGVTWDRVCVSNDRGYTWEPLIEFATSADNYLFNVIDDNIILSRGSELLHLAIDNNGLSIRAIDNEGLKGNEITSMVLFDGKVYATTLSGLFYKDFDDFFEYVE